MTQSYNPGVWYYVVAGSTTQVWSAGLAAYVPVTDPLYAAWAAAGAVPRAVASEAALVDLLAVDFPAGHPKATAKAFLAQSDALLPRALEDTWAALGMDLTKLPQATQDRLAARKAARAVVAGTS